MSALPLPSTSSESSAAWRRPLGLAECLFWQIDRVICGNFVAYAELTGTVAEEELARGLAALIEAHPILRARIVEDAAVGRPCFEAVEPAPPELVRVEPKHLRTHWLHELDRTFEEGSAPLFRAHVSGDGARTWVGLTFHHAIADGRSSARLLAELIRFLDQGVAPSPSAPPPAQESFYRPEAFGAPDKAQHFARVVADIRARAQTLAPGNVVPGLCEELRLTRENGHHELELTPEETEALVQACRRNGATVHGALGAAWLGALHAEFLPPGQPVVLSLGSPVDLRGARHSPTNTEDVAVRLSGVVSRIRVSNHEPFWELARTVTQDVRQQAELGNAHLLHELVYAQTPPSLAKESGTALIEGMMRFPWNSVITNVGRLAPPEPGRKLTLQGLGFLGGPMPNQAVVMSVSTCGGLRAHTVYDRRNITPARAESLLSRFEQRLRAAIG
ncbi:phthiocerol/phthiodiolone dimycocerosyl transferase family protein [Archangium lansingense]|uniref:Phthiocerol/phthiodiolone dimycocerosyl transferase n=1 Tax=Archangium lansingense TaxID=2995310 RepID=A0ABT4A3E4_9BACT|nr:condensation domain-containing protein [Archangium lansinium]MCY1075799.1 condensation domain-containing protein [Archangium lansinium]